jgi:hypothetical protein
MTYFRTIVLIASLVFACGMALPISNASAHVGGAVYVSFQADLAPYGEWFEYGSYGWVWRPRHVHSGWRPYIDGHWVFTDVGWTWIADEPWGWAPYHYGRWFYDSGYGWVWVPGDEWAPAWVSWHSGGGYIGWAPLPPWVVWSPGVGIAVDVSLEPSTFVFVPEREFVASDVRRFAVPIERNEIVIRNTRNVTNYTVTGSRIVNRSVDPREVERAVGHSIAPQRVDRLHAAAPRALRSVPREQARASGSQPDHARASVQREHTREERRATASRAHGRTVTPMAERRHGATSETAHAQRPPTPRHAPSIAAPAHRERGHAAVGQAQRGKSSRAAAQTRPERERAANRGMVRAHESARSIARPEERAVTGPRQAPSRPERATHAAPKYGEGIRASTGPRRRTAHVTNQPREPRGLDRHTAAHASQARAPQAARASERPAPVVHASQRARGGSDRRLPPS